MYRYHKKWRHEYESGLRRRTPNEPVAAHIKLLEDAGMTPSAVCAIAGIGRSTYYAIRNRRKPTCHVRIAAAIIAVTADSYRPEPALVPSIGARRRIQALLALGWTHDELTARCGINTALKLSQRSHHLLRRVHLQIKALYDELSMTPGTSSQTRARAHRSGYAPPLAWDDDTIDDPNARPKGIGKTDRRYRHLVDEAAVIRAVRGDRTVALSTAERREVVRRLRADGWRDVRIEAHTGIRADRYQPTTRTEAAA